MRLNPWKRAHRTKLPDPESVAVDPEPPIVEEAVTSAPETSVSEPVVTQPTKAKKRPKKRPKDKDFKFTLAPIGTQDRVDQLATLKGVVREMHLAARNAHNDKSTRVG